MGPPGIARLPKGWNNDPADGHLSSFAAKYHLLAIRLVALDPKSENRSPAGAVGPQGTRVNEATYVATAATERALLYPLQVSSTGKASTEAKSHGQH
jgi:hypothetical protein